MVQKSLLTALQNLRSERSRIDGAIAAIEALISGATSMGGRATTARAARKAPARRAKRGRARGKRKNAPKGLLKQKIHEVLKGQKKPMAPVDLRNAVIKAGYPARNPKTLYTAIFNQAKKDSSIRKTKAGFSLK